jgi:hypothetical protein
MLKVNLVLAIIATLSVSTKSQSISQTPLQPITVCEALKDLKLYNGKMIAIIGRFGATMEGRWLSDDDCAQKLISKGYIWPDGLWLKYDPSSPTAFSTEMLVDMQVANRKLEEIKTRTQLHDSHSAWAIVYGRLETHRKLKPPKESNGSGGNGFGHLGGTPAQLVFKQKDIKFIPDK